MAAPTNPIARHNLTPHPEGGFYREYYRSPLQVTSPEGERSAATAIYFLLREQDVSHFHRLKHDELWCWHEGGSALVHCLHPDGSYELKRLGPENEYTIVIPAGTWFGATVEGTHVLVTAVVAPGFEFEDFELADSTSLQAAYPEHAEIIAQLTPDPDNA